MVVVPSCIWLHNNSYKLNPVEQGGGTVLSNECNSGHYGYTIELGDRKLLGHNGDREGHQEPWGESSLEYLPCNFIMWVSGLCRNTGLEYILWV